MAELEDRFQEGVNALEEVAGGIKPPEAWRDFDQVAVEDFWRAWPEIRGWGEWLWQLVDKERGEKAKPVEEAPHEEIGGEGG